MCKKIVKTVVKAFRDVAALSLGAGILIGYTAGVSAATLLLTDNDKEEVETEEAQ